MSEARLELNLIEHLVMLGYNVVDVKSEEDMFDNWKVQLQKLNKHVVITDADFEYIKLQLNSKSNVVLKSKFIRETLTFPDEDTGIIKEIILFDSKNWCSNIFQVTNQIVVDGPRYRNRYDVTILVNGLPLVHIELKNTTVSFEDAFHQIKRYKRDTMPDTLFDCVQLFVISNGRESRYLANTNSANLNIKYAFEWKDENNVPITQLFEFATSFLSPCALGKYIAKFIIVEHTIEDGNSYPKLLKAMRSYQVHATEGILTKILEEKKGGYIWHTTGSGKTLTSFKVCELLAELKDVDKVLFVVDRTDLDNQTTDEYKKFRSVTDNSLNGIEPVTKTLDLIKQLNSTASPIIITTIQKLNKAVTDYKSKLVDDKNVILIFDECHRTQFGDMHQNIDIFFKSPLKFGFTGTPILLKNAKTDGNEFATTNDVFGDCIHSYLINDAIDDRNVLGFDIDYKSVLKDKDIQENKRKDVYGIDRKEIFNSPEYLKQIAMDVVETYDRFTSNRNYNAMLATGGIDNAIVLYRLLNGEEVDGIKLDVVPNLKLACIYSYSENKDGLKNHRVMMEKIIDDYNHTYEDAKYSLDTFKEFKKNVSKRVKDREVDLLIVSDMFLTGFDAPQLSTLYFDKIQNYHNVIQAISRTNRIYDAGKDYGKIVCYHPIMQTNIDEALALFSNENAPQNYLKVPYQEMLEATIEAVNILLLEYEEVPNISYLKGDDAKYNFVQVMRNVNRLINKLEKYRDFTFKDLPITEYRLKEYNSAYDDIRKQIVTNSDPDSILRDIDFEIELIKKVHVDYDYIIRLLKSLDDKDPDDFQNLVVEILNRIKKDVNLKNKYDLIKSFFEQYYNIDTYRHTSIDEALIMYNSGIEKEAAYELANELVVDEQLVLKFYDSYYRTNDIEVALNLAREYDKNYDRDSKYKKIKKRNHHKIIDYIQRVKEQKIDFL